MNHEENQVAPIDHGSYFSLKWEMYVLQSIFQMKYFCGTYVQFSYTIILETIDAMKPNPCRLQTINPITFADF